ncbi:MAG: hypothetical protein K0Q63_1796 [Paenibacillus sp.]|jgi:hypothetical protein|nr:hypothetical protein [Paenibacillus sp.]
MNWSMAITLCMPVILLVEIPNLRSLRSKRDAWTFATVWLIATCAMAAEWAGVPLPRPMEWIRYISAPINRLLP